MIHFNDVKDKILSLIPKIIDANCKYYVIRDVFGRISMYILGSTDINFIKEKVLCELGSEWVNNIANINETDFIYNDLVNSTEEIFNNVFYVERPLVKKSWKSPKRPDIDLKSKVVAFYSYKGGLGRTTTLMLTALQLVRRGKKVVIVDFDLEAPGVATLLRPENEDYYPKYGTIDFLIESSNYSNSDKQIDIDDYVYPITSKKLTGLSGGELFVMQATKTSFADCNNYFEKLSRIDFGMPLYEKPGNPIEQLLKQIDERYSPDFILLDSRAGIHDIGGITLTKYTDEVVCIFYGNTQNMFGLSFVLPTIVREDIPFYLINSPVPLSEEEAEEERTTYIKHSYNVLSNCGYYDVSNLPDLFDESSDHFPLDIKYNPEATIINSESKIDTLLSNDGLNNIYYKLAESLDTDVIYQKQNYDEIDKKEILESISKISPETAAAENEFKTLEDLRKKFYPLKEHKYIFDSSKFLIVGPKGSGKTALFSVLKHAEYAKALAQYVNVPMDDINKTEWLVGLGISEHYPNPDNFSTIGRENNIDFYRKYWQCLALRILNPYINEFNISISSQLKEAIECKYSELKDIINEYKNIGELISDLLTELDSKLTASNKIIIITYDFLDVALRKEDNRGKMIAALISFWFENITRLKNIKSKIFLRDDIFKFEVKEGITDRIKLNNYTANLAWTYDLLLALVWKRMIENNKELALLLKKTLSDNGYNLIEVENLIGFLPTPSQESNILILKELIGEKMGKGKKAYTYNWISLKLKDTKENIVPRSILKLFSISALNELRDTKSSTESSSILRPKSLENSLEAVSSDRLRDLSDEYPEYTNVFYDIKNYCPTFPQDEGNFMDALIKCGVDPATVKTNIDELISIGILKEYQRKKSDPIRYHIPDIYLKGMGLVRKGSR